MVLELLPDSLLFGEPHEVKYDSDIYKLFGSGEYEYRRWHPTSCSLGQFYMLSENSDPFVLAELAHGMYALVGHMETSPKPSDFSV